MSDAPNTTYLERSDHSSHKFYEVTVSGTDVTVRYGRIGTNGQRRAIPFGSSREANGEAEQRVFAKLHAGYVRATPGQRRKKPVAPRRGYSGTVYLDDAPAVEVPTSDGRRLRFDPDAHYRVAFTWTPARIPDTDDELPTDEIELTCKVPDAEGRIWTSTHRLSAWSLYEEWARTQFENDRSLWIAEDAPDEVQAAFLDHSMLTGISLSSDDRMYRTVWLRDERVQFIFHYSNLIFDLATPDEGETIYARLREGDAFSPDQPLDQIHHAADLPALIFSVHSDADPLAASHVDASDETGPPNEAVTVVEAV